jgi:hypothetical protein
MIIEKVEVSPKGRCEGDSVKVRYSYNSDVPVGKRVLRLKGGL